MNKFYFNYQTCSKCGACADVCPNLLIHKNSENFCSFIIDDLHLCLKCGQCMAVCPTKSVFANGMNYIDDFFEFSNSGDFFSLIQKRRSVRRFKPAPISKVQTDKILEAVASAPHGDFTRHVQVTVVNSRDIILKALPYIINFYDNIEKWLKNPIIRQMIIFEKGRDTLNTLKNHILPGIKSGRYRKFSYEYDGITRGAHTLFIFHAPKNTEQHTEDAYIYVTYAALAAEALGLGAAIIGLTAPAINKSKELKKIFNIPENHDSVISLIAGQPVYKYRRGIKANLSNIKILE